MHGGRIGNGGGKIEREEVHDVSYKRKGSGRSCGVGFWRG